MIRFSNSFNELNPNLDWENDSNINQSWRGYEVYLIIDNFNNSSILNKIFGNGFGSFIYIEKDVIVYETINDEAISKIIHEIPIFHNGYFGALFKCGIAGVLLYISFL